MLLKVNGKWKWKEEKSFNYCVNLHVKFGRPKQSVVLTEATELVTALYHGKYINMRFPLELLI